MSPKRRLPPRNSVVLLAALLILSACASAEKTVRVLFVGNSYTYYNNMPGIAAALYDAAQPGRMEVGMLVQAGQSLDDAAGPRMPELLRMMMGGRWDYVVLQEQSTLGGGFRNGMPVIGAPTSFHQSVRILDKEIRKSGSRTALLVTWANARALEQQDTITRAYEEIATETEAILVPAGPVWTDVLAANPDIALHQVDGSHPSVLGSYLTACVLLETLFDIDLSESPTSFEVQDLLSPGRRGREKIDIDPDVATILRDAAERAGSR